VEKDLKVIKGRSGKHEARLEGQYIGIFPTPIIPPGFGDMDVEREGRKRGGKRRVVNPGLSIDLDASDLEEDKNFVEMVLSVFGLEPKEADFDVFSVMEKILRALAKAKFSNLARLELNDNVVYEHPEKELDLRDVLENIKDYVLDERKIEEARARVIDGEEGETEASITVDKIHTNLTHDIRIEIKGEIEEEYVNRIINYLEENLQIEKMLER
jgi:hypothetical protein